MQFENTIRIQVPASSNIELFSSINGVNYDFYGTQTLTSAVSVTAKGTPKRGHTVYIHFNATLTYGASGSLTIFGTTFPEDLLTIPHLIIAKYNGSSWDVKFLVDYNQDDIITNDHLSDMVRGTIKAADNTGEPSDFSILGGIPQGGATDVELLSAGTAGNLILSNGSKFVSLAMTGDVTISSLGVTAIGAGKVTNAMLAALSEGYIKIGNNSNVASDLDISTNAGFLIGNGTTATVQTISGDVVIDNTGAATIQAGAVTNAMLDALSEGYIKIGNSSNVASDLDISTNTGFLVGNGTTAVVRTMGGDATMANDGTVTLDENMKWEVIPVLLDFNTNEVGANNEVYVPFNGTLKYIKYTVVEAIAATNSADFEVFIGASSQGTTNIAAGTAQDTTGSVTIDSAMNGVSTYGTDYNVLKFETTKANPGGKVLISVIIERD